MKLSKLSNRHWRNKVSEAVEAFVVLCAKAGSTLDQLKETAYQTHTVMMQAEALICNLLNATGTDGANVDALLKDVGRIADTLDRAFPVPAAPMSVASVSHANQETTQPDRTCHRCTLPALFVDSFGEYLCKVHAEDSSRTCSPL